MPWPLSQRGRKGKQPVPILWTPEPVFTQSCFWGFRVRRVDGRDVAQVVSHRLPTAAARVRALSYHVGFAMDTAAPSIPPTAPHTHTSSFGVRTIGQ
jgi:hypothetical protein